jgi:hypothetical protein
MVRGHMSSLVEGIRCSLSLKNLRQVSTKRVAVVAPLPGNFSEKPHVKIDISKS